jgi:hypothetical protein
VNEHEIAWAQEVIRISGFASQTVNLLNPHARNCVHYAALHIAKLTEPVVEA